MSSIKDCPFCNPAQRILKENQTAYVLLSNPSKVRGHFLVMPKRHIEKPWELSSNEIHDIFELVFFIERKILGKLGEGCDIRQHYRPFLPQDHIKVDHVHFHVIPRSLNDRIYQEADKYDMGLFRPLDKIEHDEVARLLEDEV